MLSTQTQIGATTQGTTFADIIINNVSGVADGAIQGFASFLHDPKSLKETVSAFAKAATPKKFADAVVLRRIETQKLDDIWEFPLNMSVPTTCPIPWTIIESTVRSGSRLSPEFNIMRTVDFIGRNYVMIRLPRVDCSEIRDTHVASAAVNIMSDPDHIYLGAWHRDLIPRLINKVSFYPRSNSHRLFEYTGYDIYVHNILFGNAHKCMNDLMAGEDKFELCYDPYFVDGAALGLASFKGIDVFKDYDVEQDDEKGLVKLTPNQGRRLGTDGIVDYFQVDSTMDNFEFREFYRKGVWFEPPVARNYHARHSIHSRRMIHQAKDISIPLDILPFGYSVASSLPSAALSGECGFIKIEIFEDWVDRAFYLTRVSDVPSLHPLVNHLHYQEGDKTPTGVQLEDSDPRLGWVNEFSLGRYGDPTFQRATSQVDEEGTKSGIKFSQAGNVVGAGIQTRREGIVPSTFTSDGDNFELYQRKAGGRGVSAFPGQAKISRSGVWSNVRKTSTVNDAAAVDVDDTYSGFNLRYLWKMSEIDASYSDRIKNELSVKLMQIGYQTLPCIRELLAKLPNIYITTEWNDETHSLNDTRINITNDLYIQGIVLWFIPEDAGNIQSMRVYANHLQDHELPIVAGIRLMNEQSQGTTVYDWNLLNLVTPAQMNLNPLLENMGLLSFSPKLTANTLPLAYYDSNISGYLKLDFKPGEGEQQINNVVINLNRGSYKVITIGVKSICT